MSLLAMCGRRKHLCNSDRQHAGACQALR